MNPRGNLVQVKLLPPESMTRGGLHIPDIAKKKNDFATVVALGKGTWTKEGGWVPLPLNVGDTVIVDTTYLMKVRHGGEELQFVREEDVGAVVEA